MDVDAFLHDLRYFFGVMEDGMPYAIPVANADCERFEGVGYAYQCWVGGEYTMMEMLVGEERVYMQEYDYPLMETD